MYTKINIPFENPSIHEFTQNFKFLYYRCTAIFNSTVSKICVLLNSNGYKILQNNPDIQINKWPNQEEALLGMMNGKYDKVKQLLGNSVAECGYMISAQMIRVFNSLMNCLINNII